MIRVVGIEFKEVGKIYWFDPTPFDMQKDEYVVVETVRGVEIGRVAQPVKEVHKSEIEHELKRVQRKANQEDIKKFESNKEKARESFRICKKIVNDSGLKMKLLDCEYTLDQQKLIIYYNADGRVDFRELLKDLASTFRVRIELRQVGPREGAKFLGGIGTCGRELCCAKHLREFDLVTMKMAKEQGMTLNASKVAGVCGKLMCCIAYEDAIYGEKRERIPAVGDMVKSPNCASCKVINVNYVKEEVTTYHDDNYFTWSASDVSWVVKKQEEVSQEDLSDDAPDV